MSVVVLGGCGDVSKQLDLGDEFDPAKLERAIKQGADEQTGLNFEVSCPSGVKFRENGVFECSGVEAHGRAVRFEITQTDADGNIDWKLVDEDGAVDAVDA